MGLAPPTAACAAGDTAVSVPAAAAAAVEVGAPMRLEGPAPSAPSCRLANCQSSDVQLLLAPGTGC